MQPDHASPGPLDPGTRAEVLTVSIRRDGATTVVLDGELDMHGVGELTRAVAEALLDRPDVLEIDTAGLLFMDSAGLKSLLQARTAAAEAGSVLRLRRPSESVRRVIGLAGLDGVLLS
jgi:anti-sigma B factor antagonist